MSVNIPIARAAISGTAQLLTLCSFGAYLAKKQVLTLQSSSAWSRAIFNVFLPSLLFISILETLSQTQTSTTTTNIYLPAFCALITFLVSAVIAFLIIRLAAKGIEEAVKRVLFVALLLGNANNLPILLLRSLCENYQPFQDDSTCVHRGVGYVAMFLAAWNTLMWSVVLSYLLNIPSTEALPQVSSSDPPSTTSTVPFTALPSLSSLSSSVSQSFSSFPKRSRFEKVFSPPLIAILSAALVAHVTPLSDLLRSGTLLPVYQSLRLLANIVVPASSLIVGARLYAFYNQSSPSKAPTLSAPLTALIVLTRFLLLPIIGRLLFKLFRVSLWIDDPLLKIYLLIPYFMPTASNSVVMVQMAMAILQSQGSQMEHALLTLIFWQYVLAPLCLTINMAMALLLVFE